MYTQKVTVLNGKELIFFYLFKFQNGYVECDIPDPCPPVHDCYILVKNSGKCCKKCKECYHNGKHHPSGSEWTDPDDPCRNFQCVSGVVTESPKQCYTPCSDPNPARIGQCCPTCRGK